MTLAVNYTRPVDFAMHFAILRLTGKPFSPNPKPKESG